MYTKPACFVFAARAAHDFVCVCVVRCCSVPIDGKPHASARPLAGGRPDRPPTRTQTHNAPGQNTEGRTPQSQLCEAEFSVPLRRRCCRGFGSSTRVCVCVHVATTSVRSVWTPGRGGERVSGRMGISVKQCRTRCVHTD